MSVPYLIKVNSGFSQYAYIEQKRWNRIGKIELVEYIQNNNTVTLLLF